MVGLGGIVLGVHLAAAHAGASEPMRSVTPGVYAVLPSGWAGGVYGNSVGKASVWAGRVFETADRRFALTLGAVTGYGYRDGQHLCAPGYQHTRQQPCYRGKGNDLSPLASASVRLPITENLAARLSYMPKVGTGAHAFHLSVEF